MLRAVMLVGLTVIVLYISINENTPSAIAEREAVVEKIKANEPTVGEIYMSAGRVLYIGTQDDGMDKSDLARYYCQSYGKEGKLTGVKIVKIGTRHMLGQTECE